MKFGDITGQEEVKSMLRRSIDEGRVAHAQLFSGESGTGALPLALAYIQYLNCTDRTAGDSCGVCPSCVKIERLVHPDLHFVFPSNVSKGNDSSQKHTSDHFMLQWREMVAKTGGYFDEQMWYDALELGNRQGHIAKREAEEVIRKLSFKSFEALYKCVVVWLPERMGDEAANSLLKILEEPWERTLFLLVSVAPRRLLPTILSRVQEISVPLLDRESLEKYASSHGAEEDKAKGAARLANGNLLRLQNIISADYGEKAGEDFEYFAELMRYCYNDRHTEILAWAENMASLGREAQKRYLEYSTALLRESYMFSAGLENISYLWGGEAEFCSRFSRFIGNHNIEELVEENRRALLHIAQNGNPKIIFTHYALSVSKLIVK